MEDLITTVAWYKSIVASVSVVSLVLVSIYLFKSSKFTHHPYPLIALACLFEAIYYEPLTVRVTLIGFNPLLWIKQNIDEDSFLWRYFIIIKNKHFRDRQTRILRVVFWLSCTYLNTIFFLDLYLIMTNPFGDRQ
jgi:hypothetical protein